MERISFETPVIWLVAIVLVAIILSSLYYRRTDWAENSRIKRMFLAFLRTLSLSILGFLLLNPLITFIDTKEQSPVLLLLQDRSESISPEEQTALDELNGTLGDRIEVVPYSFTNHLYDQQKDSLSPKATDISAAINEAIDRHYSQEKAGIVIASDGIFNQGINPLYSIENVDFPIYTVGLGDTTVYKDAYVGTTYANEIVYLDDEFIIETFIGANKASGEQVNVKLFLLKDGQESLIKSENVSFQGQKSGKTISFKTRASAPGKQTYIIRISQLNGEKVTSNNKRNIAIDVIDGRKRIDVYAASPHPDIAAIRSALKMNKNYEVNIHYGEPENFLSRQSDLVIFHELPTKEISVNSLTNSLKTRGVGLLYVLGSRTDTRTFNQLQEAISISNKTTSTTAAHYLPNPNFKRFQLDEKMHTLWENASPLLTPFGEYAIKTGSQAIALQEINKVETDYPLITVNTAGKNPIGVVSGTGLWQWRMYNYLEEDSFDLFDDLISSTIQYLTVSKDRRRFNMSIPKTIFEEREEITLTASLFDENYELINTPEVSLNVISGNKKYAYTFSRKGDYYAINLGLLEPGSYVATAKTTYDNIPYEDAIKFSVTKSEVERANTQADHELLRQLSERTRGAFVKSDAISSLTDQILSASNSKPVIYESEKQQSFIRFKWLFFVLALLLCLEWFLRRLWGSY